MHFHRLAALLVGAWLAGCVFMDMVATQNFRSVDRLLASPAPRAAERIEAMGGHDMARAFLRYQVSEQNRWYFDIWERMQIALGVALVCVLLLAAGRGGWMVLLASLMLVLVLLMHFVLTPEIVKLGRALDFVAPGAPSGDRTRFWTFHGAYSATELIKLGLGMVLAVLLVGRRRNKLQPAEVDAVHKADHSHVDR